jgi:hypothetical protein
MFDATNLVPSNFEGEWKLGVKYPIPIRVLQMNLPEGFTVTTKEGVMTGRPGDYLAIGVSGEHYPIAKEIFEKTYQLVPEGTKLRQISTVNIQGCIHAMCKSLLALLPESDTVALIVGEKENGVSSTISIVTPRGSEYDDMAQSARHLVRTTNDVIDKVSKHPGHPKPVKAEETKS